MPWPPLQGGRAWASVRSGLAWLLRSRHLPGQFFDTAETFRALLRSGNSQAQTCCLRLDVRLPGMRGMALFETMMQRSLPPPMPAIFLTGAAELPTAVDAVKRGAFDFCEKPVSGHALVDPVEPAIAQSAQILQQQFEQHAVERRPAELIGRESAARRLVVQGLSDKLIAEPLDINVRTVEVRRARVFETMVVKSAVELADLCLTR